MLLDKYNLILIKKTKHPDIKQNCQFVPVWFSPPEPRKQKQKRRVSTCMCVDSVGTVMRKVQNKYLWQLQTNILQKNAVIYSNKSSNVHKRYKCQLNLMIFYSLLSNTKTSLYSTLLCGQGLPKQSERHNLSSVFWVSFQLNVKCFSFTRMLPLCPDRPDV